MVRIGGGWNTLDNYLARCDPCRSQKNSASSAAVLPTSAVTSITTSSSIQSATSCSEDVSEHQRQMLVGDRLNSSCSDLPSSSPPSEVTKTTVTTSGRQQITRRLSDLSLTSQALPVSNANCRSVYRRSPPTTTTRAADPVITDADDVAVDTAAAERCSSRCDDDTVVTRHGSVHLTSTPPTSHQHLTSTSSSPSLAAAETTASVPVDTSFSCSRPLASDDDVRRRPVDSRSFSCRPSRIPVPLRVAAQSGSHSASFNRQICHRHKRCDSGVDLNLSSPDFD